MKEKWPHIEENDIYLVVPWWQQSSNDPKLVNDDASKDTRHHHCKLGNFTIEVQPVYSSSDIEKWLTRVSFQLDSTAD